MSKSLSSGNVSAGLVVLWCGGSAAVPSGWLLCNGTAVSRTANPSLFAAIGTQYGPGDGSTTFNLPDMRSCMPVGQDAGSAKYTTLGGKGGSSQVTLTAANLPAHTHTGQAPSAGAHNHSGSTTSSGSHTHQAPTAGGKNGGYAGNWSQTGGGLWFSDGGYSWTSSTQGDHSHTYPASSTSGGHTHTVTTGNGPGQSAPVTITNPYVAIHFIIMAS